MNKWEYDELKTITQIKSMCYDNHMMVTPRQLKTIFQIYQKGAADHDEVVKSRTSCGWCEQCITEDAGYFCRLDRTILIGNIDTRHVRCPLTKTCEVK